MDQPPDDIVARQDEQARAISELSCQVRLLTQRVEAGFAESSEADHRLDGEIKQLKADLEKRIDNERLDMIARDSALKADLTAQINTVKADLTARIDTVERKLDIYARIFLATNAALVAALIGKMVLWW